MLDQVIAHERRALSKEKDTNAPQVPESKKDLLALMIESEKNGEGAHTDEELKMQ